MSDIPLKEIIDTALGKIGTVADVNTVIGEPITLPDGVTVLPYSKISVGFASGGADYENKSNGADKNFAGGNGAGVSVVPLGFIIVNNGNVNVVDLKSAVPQQTGTVDKVINAVDGITNRAPEIIEKLKELFKKGNKTDSGETAE